MAGVVLVTGCSKGGIGYALCQQLAARGCTVYATARKLGLLDGLQQCGCHVMELDVTDSAAAERVLRQVLAQSGRIDMLVNNAGSIIKGWAVDTPLADVRNLMEASAYSASKFAVRGFSDALRVELSPFGVHVMHVAPGFIKTNLMRSNTTVGLRGEDSPYSQFSTAMQLLQHNNELSTGVSGWGATDPQVFAARLAKAMLSPHPPRHYHDGWMWRVFYLLGCYAPLWFTDTLHRVRLRLYTFLK